MEYDTSDTIFSLNPSTKTVKEVEISNDGKLIAYQNMSDQVRINLGTIMSISNKDCPMS